MWPYAALLLAYLVINSAVKGAKDFASQYTVKLHSIRFLSGETIDSLFKTLFFDITLYLQNPTQFKGEVTGSKFQIYYSGRLLGTAQSNSKVQILPKGETPLVMRAALNVADVIKAAPQVLESLKAGTGISLTVQGEINTALGTLKFSQTQNVV